MPSTRGQLLLLNQIFKLRHLIPIERIKKNNLFFIWSQQKQRYESRRKQNYHGFCPVNRKTKQRRATEEDEEGTHIE